MTPQEILAVVTAACEGKQIETRRKGTYDWFAAVGIEYWNFDNREYRVRLEEKFSYKKGEPCPVEGLYAESSHVLLPAANSGGNSNTMKRSQLVAMLFNPETFSISVAEELAQRNPKIVFTNEGGEKTYDILNVYESDGRLVVAIGEKR